MVEIVHHYPGYGQESCLFTEQASGSLSWNGKLSCQHISYVDRKIKQTVDPEKLWPSSTLTDAEGYLLRNLYPAFLLGT